MFEPFEEANAREDLCLGSSAGFQRNLRLAIVVSRGRLCGVCRRQPVRCARTGRRAARRTKQRRRERLCYSRSMLLYNGIVRGESDLSRLFPCRSLAGYRLGPSLGSPAAVSVAEYSSRRGRRISLHHKAHRATLDYVKVHR